MSASTGVRRWLLVALAGALVLGGLSPAEANHSQRYQELQRKIAETRAKIREAQKRENDIIGQLQASDQRRADLERRLAAIVEQLGAAQDRLSLTKVLVDQAAVELEIRTQQLEEALGALDDQTNRLNTRAARVYIRGPIDHSEVVLGAADLDTLVSGFQYTRSVLRFDSDLLGRVRETKDRVAEARRAVEDKKAELESVQAAQEAEAGRIDSMRAVQASARNQVLAEIDYRKKLLAQVRSEKEAFLRALQSFINESRSIEQLLRGVQRGQKVIQGIGGYLTWPISGRISSGFGWRMHPIWHKRMFHAGVDIGAPFGATVRSARAGEVIWAGYRGAYGLVVIVDHGNSLATLYAHLSKVYVRVGDQVAKQEALAAVGCTGWCTGPHVHFETRVQGVPQNPLGWL